MGTGKRKAECEDFSVAAGSSSGVSRSTQGPKRRKKDPNALAGEHSEQVEKRLARFKSSCPKNIMERVHRVMTQRFFMIDRKRVDGEYREEFKVLGSTGNVYTVVIDKQPSCNCPDATKGNHCKHILFIFLKVLSVPMTSTLYYQKALLSTELESLFAQAPAAPNSLIHPRVQAVYAKAMGHPDGAALESNAEEYEQKKRRIPQEEDDCPICYETMYKVDVKSLIFCDECGNALHNECFRQWAKTASVVTCVWCRANWKVSAGTAGGSSNAAPDMSEGYLNLGAAAGVSPVRDTSSYYNGPRRGQSWRYGRYY